ncbi:hypothetical protein [Anaerolentibacter hominis]|uniref:hypothetical protein n=1 Tax=Anaerolentibacter hominis TaxID=3079009 RepID=UPI0031B7F23F
MIIMIEFPCDIYEDTMKQLNLYRELTISETQIREGRIKDARDSLESMREKYEL